jgi:hypothetical protein
MLFILNWIKTLLRLPRPVPPSPPPLPVTSPVIPPISGPDPALTAVAEISTNRHERRVLERRRRKHDKFVTPKGAPPAKPKRETQEIKPRLKKVELIVPDQPGVEDAEFLIVDTHHENRAENVLYKEAELYGEFNFRDTILQQLDRYFVYIDRMKKHDAETYGFYRQVGATLLPYMSTMAWDREGTSKHDPENVTRVTELSGWFNQTRPAFGCYVYGADPETERFEKASKSNGHEQWVPKFMYFRKYKMPPPEIQMMAGGDVYAMTVYWDRPWEKKMKYGVPQEFGIFVSRDGKEVVALRSCETKWVPIRAKVNGAHGRRGKTFSIPKRAWRIPGEFDTWAKEHGDTAQHYLTELFKEAVRHSEQAQYSMIRVMAEKSGTAAVFSVNAHRTAYFFQDRDYHLTEAGVRKRIFHFVRPHVRSDGVAVKAHFRGEREFNWAGYKITITVPGRDHFIVDEFNVGASDEYWLDKNAKYLTMPQVGKKLRGWMDQGVGARR